MKYNMHKAKTDAEMADVSNMGRELDERHGTTRRHKTYPAVVSISNSKNTYAIGDKYTPEAIEYLKVACCR